MIPAVGGHARKIVSRARPYLATHFTAPSGVENVGSRQADLPSENPLTHWPWWFSDFCPPSPGYFASAHITRRCSKRYGLGGTKIGAQTWRAQTRQALTREKLFRRRPTLTAVGASPRSRFIVSVDADALDPPL